MTVVVGNPKPHSRTRRVAEHVAAHIRDEVGLSQGDVYDLAEYASSVFRSPDRELDRIAATVAHSAIAVVASPTYKASYTGLLKAFLDRYGDQGLAGVVTVPVMTGAAPHHAMAPETHLRPLLVELGASVPTSSLYFLIDRIDNVDYVVSEWVGRNAAVLTGLRAAAAART